MRKLACGVVLASALFALARPASAQQTTYTENETADGQDIRFHDDPLGALGHESIGAQLTGFHPPRRYDLLRPRTTWVPELLKTVEHL